MLYCTIRSSETVGLDADLCKMECHVQLRKLWSNEKTATSNNCLLIKILFISCPCSIAIFTHLRSTRHILVFQSNSIALWFESSAYYSKNSFSCILEMLVWWGPKDWNCHHITQVETCRNTKIAVQSRCIPGSALSHVITLLPNVVVRRKKEDFHYTSPVTLLRMFHVSICIPSLWHIRIMISPIFCRPEHFNS